MERFILDNNYLEALRSPKGGYTKALTDLLGVKWPLENGWKRRLAREGRSITQEEFDILLNASSVKCKKKRRNRN